MNRYTVKIYVAEINKNILRLADKYIVLLSLFRHNFRSKLVTIKLLRKTTRRLNVEYNINTRARSTSMFFPVKCLKNWTQAWVNDQEFRNIKTTYSKCVVYFKIFSY